VDASSPIEQVKKMKETSATVAAGGVRTFAQAPAGSVWKRTLPCFLLALFAGLLSRAAAADATVPDMATRTTEEGQTVAFDRYTWERRELDKHLPPDQAWPAEGEISRAFERFVPKDARAAKFIEVPARVLGDIYLVNSEPNLTYVIDAGTDGLILIDPGLTMNVASIRANIARLGLSTNKVRWVINTHAHFDHSMADASFREAGAEILIGADDAAAVETGGLSTGISAFLPDVPFPATKVDRRLADGEILKLGNKTLYVIHTPGHTPGSCSFLLQQGGRNLLFSGDTLLYDNRLGFQQDPYANNRQYQESLKKLADFRLNFMQPLRWDVLLPGHGAIVLDRAYMDVEKGLRTVQIDQLEGYRIEALPFATPLYRSMMFGRP